jgi:hypothetical protein
MSDTNGTGPRKPLAVYAIPPEGEDGEKRFWTKIGVAFTNRDGSTTLILDALPLGTNKLQVREQKLPAERSAGVGNRNGDRRFETVEVHP